MTEPFLPPQIVSLSRRQESTLAVNDSAILQLQPNTLLTLMTGNPPPGRGLHPLSSVPFGLAVEAAIQACGKEKTEVDVLRAAEVTLDRPLDKNQPLFAEAHVQSVGRRHVQCQVSVYQNAATKRQEVLRATITLVRVVDGRAVQITE